MMTLKELDIELKKHDIPDDSYSLQGGLPNEVFCITKENEKWETYYSERGNKTALKFFDFEDEACNYFLMWIKRNFKIK